MMLNAEDYACASVYGAQPGGFADTNSKEPSLSKEQTPSLEGPLLYVCLEDCG